MNGAIALARIKGAAAVDALDGRFNLLELARQRAWINHRAVGEQSGDDLLRVGIHAEVELAPAAAIILAMGADFPFALAQDLQAEASKTRCLMGLADIVVSEIRNQHENQENPRDGGWPVPLRTGLRPEPRTESGHAQAARQ